MGLPQRIAFFSDAFTHLSAVSVFSDVAQAGLVLFRFVLS